MKKVRIGVIGCGSIADNYHLPAMAKCENAEFVWACDIIEERAIKAKEKFGFEKTTLDYKEVLADESVEAICIFTKIDTHATMAIEACSLGKKIFMQKPFAYNIDEGRRIIKAIKDNDISFTPSFMHSYLPESLQAKAIIESGEIGKVESVLMRNTLHNPYHTAPSYGGAMMDIGCHGIDLIRTMTGQDYLSVFAVTPRNIDPDKVVDTSTDLGGDERRATLVYHMTDGVTAVHEVNWSKVGNTTRCEMEIHGEKGTVYLLNPYNKEGVIYVSSEKANNSDLVKGVKIDVAPKFYGLTHHETLINDWANDTTDSKTPEDGFYTLAVIHAARKSMASGKPELVEKPQ